ncbi:MAG: phosphatidylserine/phosphatidylglycerophosphate/cardiolipin synthase family protein [Vicinamibacterales bacterium]
MAEPRRRRHWPYRVAILVGLVAIFLLIAQDQRTLRVDSPVEAADPRFADYLASLVGTVARDGDNYTVLRNGDEVYPAMLADLAEARSRIVFETYVFSDGAVGRQFIAAFEAAARRGVTVRVLLDSVGSSLPQESEERLARAGVQLKWFNPLRFWTLEETNYRTHRKVLVIDGDIAYTGGLGVDDQWLGHAQDQDHWRDTQFKVVGPAVRTLEASFYENWIESGGRSAPALDPEPPAWPTGARSVVLWSNPTAGASNIKLLYLIALAAARHTIDIQSPYITLDSSTRWALNEARRRGVRVRMLSEGPVTDAMPVKHASRAEYQALLDLGIAIAEYQPTMMHTKAVIIDGVVSVIGSANFGNRSFELNDEQAIAVQDRSLAAALLRDFDADWQRSQVFDAATWEDQRSIVGKAQEFFWRWFSEVF